MKTTIAADPDIDSPFMQPPNANGSDRKRQNRLLACNVVSGVIVGTVMFRFWSLGPQPLWYEFPCFAYFTGLLPIVVLASEFWLFRLSRSVLLGLSLTLPLYGAFILPWLLDRGSFRFEFVVLPFSGLIIGPIAATAMRKLKRSEQVYPPVCRCGYSLRHLTSNSCPECGEPVQHGTVGSAREG